MSRATVEASSSSPRSMDAKSMDSCLEDIMMNDEYSTIDDDDK